MAENQELLSTYMNDHRAGAEAAIELAGEAAENNNGTPSGRSCRRWSRLSKRT